MENGEQVITEEEQPLPQQQPIVKKNIQYDKPWYKKLWEKSIFPDLIEKKKQKRKTKEEEEKWLEDLKKEIKEESKEEIKKQLKTQIIKQEVDRLNPTKKKTGILQKVAKDFSQDLGRMGSKDIGAMMGAGNQNTGNIIGIGNQNKGKQSKKKERNWEDKIKDMLK